MQFSFGNHSLDPERFELRRDGLLVAIQAKVLEFLVFLAQNRDRVVSQSELLAALWPDSAVTVSSLARVVSLARRALGDSTRNPRMIVTVARRGYRFVAPVEVEAAAETPIVRTQTYVGRAQILKRARSALDSALSNHGRILLLAGEAGIGKTKTAELLAEWALAARAEVAAAWGLVTEAPTYWSWTRVLRQLIGADPRSFESLTPLQRSYIARIVPEVDTGRAIAMSSSSETSRVRIFDAVVNLLARVARNRPLAIVLDDLHAADAESLGLLEFLGRSLGSHSIVVIATCREDDVAMEPQQARALERILRLGCLERWPLTGLLDAEVHELVSLQLGRVPDPGLIAALERKTGGNPLLLVESLRSLEARDLLGQSREQSEWESFLPRGIEHLLRPKLRQISSGALDVLSCAAAIGMQMDRELLVRSVQDPSALDGWLEEIVGVGLLVAGPGGGRLGFSHTLVRDAVYDSLLPPGSMRRRLHARILRALDEGDAGSGVRLAQAARHACEGVPIVDAADATALARAAAEEAARLNDFEGAASWFGRALEARAHLDSSHLELTAELALGLAMAQVRAVGLASARDAFARATDTARRSGRSDLLALAALGFAQRPNSTGQADPEVADLLDEALGFLPIDGRALRVRVSSRLAAEIRYSEFERTALLASNALAEARRLGDPAVLAQTLDDCTFMQWTPSDPSGWIDLNLEVVEQARAAGNLDLEISGHKGCASGRLEMGDLAGAQQAIRACDRIARKFPTPYARWWSTVFMASRALIDGEWDRAEGLVLESLRIADRIEAPEVAIEVQAQMVYLRTEQGRASEIEEAAAEQVRRYPRQPTWSAALGRILVASGRLEEAREAIRPLVERRFSDPPLDRGWLGTQALAAEVVSRLGDERSAERLAANLRPYSARSIVIGSAVYYGPVSHYLGLLAAARADWDEAIGCFETALADEKRMGARVFAARSGLACARALLARGRAGDRARSAKLVREGLEAARKRAFAAVLQEASPLCD